MKLFLNSPIQSKREVNQFLLEGISYGLSRRITVKFVTIEKLYQFR